MGTKSGNGIKAMIAKDILDIHNRCMEVKKSINDDLEETVNYLHALLAQIPQSTSGPLITKTPKVLRKKGTMQRIETIPENDIINIDNTVLNSTMLDNKMETQEIKAEVAEETIGRTRRKASKRAADSIKYQQSLSLSTKLRRPSNIDEVNDTKKKHESRSKRKKSARSSSDEETTHGPKKHSKIEKNNLRETISKEVTNLNSQDSPTALENVMQEEMNKPLSSSINTRSSNRKRTFSECVNPKKSDILVNDTVIAPTGSNDIEESSMYEDAIGKPTPIMNSTMNFNSTYNVQTMGNVTVVLERISTMQLNETVTIERTLLNNNKQEMVEQNNEFKLPKVAKLASRSSITLQDRIQGLKEMMKNKEFDDLITEDESSPEVKKRRGNIKKRPKKPNTSMTSSEDEVRSTPAKPNLKGVNTVTGFQEIRNAYKTNALFSPYAKESVKKRVEAFEQAGMNSPKPVVDIDASTRMTRTKTRAKQAAVAQAEASDSVNLPEKTVTQKLARKSLAKAMKISLAKQNKIVDEHKENKLLSAQKMSKATSNEKTNNKQPKTTPLGKTKTQLPMSVSRIPHTPVNQINTNSNRALSATRANIITTMESFIQPPKSVSKRNSLDKIDDKKRKLNDEDAKKKREEALRLQTEEKRRKRQEKELKNKLAREAKERQELEKRQKAEKEREEKARLAHQMQERQREEMEKKRLAQLQRAQEKEEKRRLEEQQRLQRLQEQEEAERILAEQRRREQETEKRKETELRAQQQAAAEAMRAKNQMLMSQAKYGSKHQGPTTYILDSEPDDDDSDDEYSPKHAIPYWAQALVRKNQLAVQRYIPVKAVYKFFDTRKCTPDLTKLFQGIDRSRLKRTSSAIWKTPPRYSMME
ncbi:inner centromere protein isoform X1 [Xylocopa sonorina]|uniref:inner centromere protein isoform X1 n=1 Tax=Xylocopa sonorina TaxID=1818115 RepID=UPI00403AAABB